MTVSSASVLPAFSTHNSVVVDFWLFWGPSQQTPESLPPEASRLDNGLDPNVSCQGSRKTTTAHHQPPPTSTSLSATWHLRRQDLCGRNPRELEDGRGETRGSRLQAGSRFTTALRLFNDENNHEAVRLGQE